MLKVFISHRHKGGGSAYAHIIANRLKELGIETFLDVKSIMNGKFEEYIDNAIKDCTDFILILTPGCLDPQTTDLTTEEADGKKKPRKKDVFLHEVNLALKEKKNILPVPIAGFDYGAVNSPIGEKIKKYQNATGNVSLDLTKMDAFIEQLISYFKDKEIAKKLQYKFNRFLLSRGVPTRLTSRKALEGDTLYERWHDAKRVKMISVSASAITEGNRDSFLRCMDEGVRFDVVIYNPSSDVAQIATRANLSNGSKSKLIDHIRNGYRNLMEIKCDPNYKDKLELRLTNQYIPAAFSIVEREGEGFSCVKVDIVAMSALKFEPRSARAYEIYDNDTENYQYYQKMFTEVWNDAVLPRYERETEECEICENLQTDKRLLFQTKSWSVYLANDQSYFGRIIVMLRRHKSSLADLSESEWNTFHQVVKVIETMYKTLFDATLLNWECLMNGAYRNSRPQPHVHFHCIPRFRAPVFFNQKTYVDTEFGSHAIVDKVFDTSEEEIDALHRYLKERVDRFIGEIDD